MGNPQIDDFWGMECITRHLLYNNSKNYEFGILSIFVSTYMCVQVFSSMKELIIGKLRKRTTLCEPTNLFKTEDHFLLSKHWAALQENIETDNILIIR